MAKAVSSYPFKPSSGGAPAELHDSELPNPAALSSLSSLSLVNRTALYKASFERGVDGWRSVDSRRQTTAKIPRKLPYLVFPIVVGKDFD